AASAQEEARLLPTDEFEIEDDYTTYPKPSVTSRSWYHLSRTPVTQQIKPFFPSVQEAPVRLLHRLLPKRNHKLGLLIGYLALYTALFILLLLAELPLQDGEGQHVINLDCVDTLWRRKNECGLDGIDCRPFTNTTFAFRCPADCAGVQLLNPRVIGPIEVNYRPLVVGDNPYRADSFVCASAIHAGIITDAMGGCGRLSMTGSYDAFPSTRKNGIESIEFDSHFPSSFKLLADTSFQCKQDPRMKLLLLSLLFTSCLSIFSTESWHFFTIFTMIFAQVAFASDPPSASYRNVTVLPDHMSMFAKRLLPGLFCAVVIYWTVVKRTLDGLYAQFEKTLLWLGGFWLGALSNYTFGWLPISRLNAHDLEQQPGAKVALAAIIAVLVLVISQQIYYFWLEGRLLPYLGLYGLFLLGIFVCLVLPGVLLRIHHYILGLLLLPGTSMQTRPSLLYQGLLLGFFVNGVARWDFDSILQTADVLRADAKFDSVLPVVLEPVIAIVDRLTVSFFWETPPAGVQGFSALVNDVERYRAFFADGAGATSHFNWTQAPDMGLSEYVRFAYVRGGRTLDYTKPGTLFPNGTWVMNESST
ncbi:hypothetical protein EJ04DRAFT_389142, partial [Polyplosphaeria fusca]